LEHREPREVLAAAAAVALSERSVPDCRIHVLFCACVETANAREAALQGTRGGHVRIERGESG